MLVKYILCTGLLNTIYNPRKVAISEARIHHTVLKPLLQRVARITKKTKGLSLRFIDGHAEGNNKL